MSRIPLRLMRQGRSFRPLVALLCTSLLVPGEGALLAQQPAAAAAPAAAPAAPKIPADQLDSLVAPVALYSDPLLAQTLVAATYPLEVMQLQQWLLKNPTLKDKALADAVAKQPWDPAIQSMAAFPDAVKRLGDDIQWTTDLGNAFLAQQADVMDAVQRMRKKAQEKGALTSNQQQKVETKVVEQKTVIIVQPANPEVIYVPVYSPTVVYPPPVYPYPPIYYPPPPPPGAAFMTFTAGVMIGAAVWGGSCCNCGWGHNDVNINVNNNFNRNTNINTGNINTGNINTGNKSGGGSWQHNSQHRGGAPYSNQATANKYGGTAKGSSSASRSAGASQQQARGGASAGGAKASTGGARPSTSSSAAASRSGGASAGTSASRTGSGGSGAGASPSASKAGGGGFGGGSGGFSGSGAKASSSRGASSAGGRSGGGRKR